MIICILLSAQRPRSRDAWSIKLDRSGVAERRRPRSGRRSVAEPRSQVWCGGRSRVSTCWALIIFASIFLKSILSAHIVIWAIPNVRNSICSPLSLSSFVINKLSHVINVNKAKQHNPSMACIIIVVILVCLISCIGLFDLINFMAKCVALFAQRQRSRDARSIETWTERQHGAKEAAQRPTKRSADAESSFDAEGGPVYRLVGLFVCCDIFCGFGN